MSGFKDVSHFEIHPNGSLARCRVCPPSLGEGWASLYNLRAHEKRETHQKQVRRQHRSLTSDPAPSKVSPQYTNGNSRRPYFEEVVDEYDLDLLSESSGYHPPAFMTENTAPEANNLTPALPPEIQAALAGQYTFSAGRDEPDELMESLKDAMNGLGILQAATWSGDDEAPGFLDHIDEAEGGDDSFDAFADLVSSATDNAASIDDMARAAFASGAPECRDYFPYPSKAMTKTDILFSSPRLRFSRAQKQAILTWGAENGARDIPSLGALGKFQRQALDALGNPTVKVKAASGNILYMNDPCAILARDYSHPETRRLIHVYPELVVNHAEQVWQADKWLYDVPDDVLTPMIRQHGKDYYIHELVRTVNEDTRWFIPQRFFDMEGRRMALGRTVTLTNRGFQVSNDRSIQDCQQFDLNFPEILAEFTQDIPFTSDSASYSARMPNPDREIAQGLPWECPPIILFIDDVSGASSRQWNVHYSTYMSNGGLPRSEIEKECNVHSVATSLHASPMKILQAICDAIRKTVGKTPLKVWDCIQQSFVLIRPWLLFLPADNPMQSEQASHIGLNANFFCRCCHVGGTQEYKQSDEGYPALMKPGRIRTPQETKDAIVSQLLLATKAAAEKPLKEAVTASGVKDSLATPVIAKLVAMGKILRKSTPQRRALSYEEVNKPLTEELLKKKDLPMMNPLLTMPGFDVHRDTPVEPLHTHLLGILKYFWALTIWNLEKTAKFSEFQARLNSLESSGLKIPNIMADYMCRYRGGLIGKHFKTISQVMAFAINGLVDDDFLDLWYSIGQLTVLIWETSIIDMDGYVSDLRNAINTIQDLAAILCPSILTTKPKFHVLTHLPEHVQRFGPALLFSTERYESFNRVFRLCSIHSNHLAPSRDIAFAFADLERCRHIVTGGYWFDKAQHKWVCAGSGVLGHTQHHRIDARLLGIHKDLPKVPGSARLIPLMRSKERPSLSWEDTAANTLMASPSPRSSWYLGQSVVTLLGDAARVGDEVLVRAEGVRHL